MSMTNDSIIAKLESNFGAAIPEELKTKIVSKLEEMRNYIPKVGVFGKTGVGKSSLCNALFGSDVCKISDVEACTRAPQKVLLEFGSAGIQLVDVPGVGESGQRDKEYDALYQSLLPELDLIFWVFKGDDRAAASDEDFYKRIIRRYVEAGKPFIAVINQVDKIEPYREWSEGERKPGAKQLTNIEKKRQSIAGLLDIPMNKVIAVSASERYGLVELVDSVVHELPNEQKMIVLEKIKAAEEAEIAAAQAKAAEAQAKAEEMKAKAEAERIALEKQMAEAAEKESQRQHEERIALEKQRAEAADKESQRKYEERIALEKQRAEYADKERQRQHELAMAELKARQEREQREADEKARKDREAAEERERNRNVSRKAESEAEKGVLSVIKEKVVEVANWIGRKIGSLFS